MTAMFSKVWIINTVLALLILFCWVRIWDSRGTEVGIPAQTGMIQETGLRRRKRETLFPGPGLPLSMRALWR
jgi:hypothetical protein